LPFSIIFLEPNKAASICETLINPKPAHTLHAQTPKAEPKTETKNQKETQSSA
jgi:hypothetical protein